MQSKLSKQSVEKLIEILHAAVVNESTTREPLTPKSPRTRIPRTPALFLVPRTASAIERVA